ncbi:MAG: DegV family protein [Deinococcus sp.]|uniref:DegV family protein n=1 Tax=Deinococcus sp. TaxID=47478 RepID=UPI0026DD37CD|nr:DegV family protein [Deinococcus sp.]MDO4246027.1 DegV family protein [Deinococcus sp.]
MQPAVLLDSSSDISLLQATELGVHLLLQPIEFGGKTWLDSEEISSEQLYGPLRAGVARPAPFPMLVERYSTTLERLLERANHVLAIHPNRYANGMLEVAQQAASHFPGRVTVYNAQTLSIFMALLGERAVQGFDQGLSPQQVMRQLDRFHQLSHSLLCLETTEFLPEDSPSGQAVKHLSPSLKPILRAPGGQVELLTTAPDSTAALRIMRQRLQRQASDLRGGDVVFAHRDAAEQIAVLEKTARNLGLRVRFSTTFSLTVSAVLGPGAYAFGIFPPPAEI